MKYCSIDLETTSLIPAPEHVLMFSFIIEDTDHPEIPVEELPHLTGFVWHKTITGQAYALAMNAWILDIISRRVEVDMKHLVYGADEWPARVEEFLYEHIASERLTAAGKNVAGFDMQFLPDQVKQRFKHRVMDIGMACLDFRGDQAVPDLAECKKRCGILTPVAHDAREDALDVIRCFRDIVSSVDKVTAEAVHSDGV